MSTDSRWETSRPNHDPVEQSGWVLNKTQLLFKTQQSKVLFRPASRRFEARVLVACRCNAGLWLCGTDACNKVLHPHGQEPLLKPVYVVNNTLLILW